VDDNGFVVRGEVFAPFESAPDGGEATGTGVGQAQFSRLNIQPVSEPSIGLPQRLHVLAGFMPCSMTW
jgi:hypothetical protein